MLKTPGDIIFLHVCTTNEDLDVWLLMYKVQEDKNFCPGDINILQLCTTKNNEM